MGAASTLAPLIARACMQSPRSGEESRGWREGTLWGQGLARSCRAYGRVGASQPGGELCVGAVSECRQPQQTPECLQNFSRALLCQED